MIWEVKAVLLRTITKCVFCVTTCLQSPWVGWLVSKVWIKMQLHRLLMGVCNHKLQLALRYQWRLAEVRCLLIENYSNSRQVWSSRSFLQFLGGLRPNKLVKFSRFDDMLGWLLVMGRDRAVHCTVRTVMPKESSIAMMFDCSDVCIMRSFGTCWARPSLMNICRR